YSKQQFYFQISIAEGFPSAICEAMLCNCIPIGSNVAAIPMIIGDCGFVLNKRDPEMLMALIKNALNSDTKTLAKKSRERIIELFPQGKREAELIKLIEK